MKLKKAMQSLGRGLGEYRRRVGVNVGRMKKAYVKYQSEAPQRRKEELVKLKDEIALEIQRAKLAKLKRQSEDRNAFAPDPSSMFTNTRDRDVFRTRKRGYRGGRFGF